METKEIIEGNKLIAEFMGWSRSTFDHLPDRMYKDSEGLPEGHSLGLDAANMKYHSSWDWLKPVVDEIAKYCLQYPFETNKIRAMSIIIEIRPCWYHVVEFIKWYNANAEPAQTAQK